MSALPLTVTDSSMLTVSASTGVGADVSVTNSSESIFSSVLDSSIQTDTTLVPDAESSALSEPDVATTESKPPVQPAETAVDLLSTLQASRQLDTSLQLNTSAIQESRATDISGDQTVNASAPSFTSDVSAVVYEQTDMPADSIQQSTDTKPAISVAHQEKQTVKTEDTRIPSDTLPNGTIHLAETEAKTPSEDETQSELDETGAAGAKTNTTTSGISVAEQSGGHHTKTLDGKHPAGSHETTVAETNSAGITDKADAVTVSENDAVTRSDSDSNTTPDANKSLESQQLDATNLVITPQVVAPVTDPLLTINTTSDTESANEVTSTTLPASNTAINSSVDSANKDAKTSEQKKTALLGQMIHELVTQVKDSDTASQITSDAITPATTLTEDLSISAEDKAETADNSAILPEKKTEMQLPADFPRDTASSEMTATRVHDNHGVSLTGKSALSSTGALPEQAQGLRSIHDQLPALYVKNGQVEGHELTARIMLMAGEKWQEAELQLEPQNMGKVRVQLTIDQEQQANVQFIVQHAQAKEALDQSLPRLRELLSQHGLQPGQTQVQQQTSDNAGQSWNQQMANTGQQNGRGSSASGWSNSGSNESEVAQSVTVSASQASGIDFYA